MIINNPEALKYWLSNILEPMCDADPEALARYVLALLKKEKPLKELQHCMGEQLDVFLGEQTKPFIGELFDVIGSGVYLQGADKSNVTTTTEPGQVVNDAKVSVGATGNAILDKADASRLSASRPANEIHQRQNRRTSPARASDNHTVADNSTDYILGNSIAKLRDVSPISPTKNDNEHRREQRRHSVRSKTRSRSRSRSPSRSRLHRNDNRSRGLSYRNKSPGNDADRRKGNPFRRSSGHETSPNSFRGGEKATDNDHKGARSLSPAQKNDRCRDFDEKGYCMRGETCPWDHGVNPVVLEDINNPTLVMQNSHMQNRGEYNPDAPEIWTPGSFGGPNRLMPNNPMIPFPRLPLGAGSTSYRVNAPPFHGFAPNAGPPGNTSQVQRELISVPVVEANSGGDISATQKRRYEPEDTVAVADGPTKRKAPINSRLGPPNRMGMQNNCSLELRKVPRGLNSIAHLNNHFCKFGKIVNIQVSYEGDPEAAIVTFSTHAEANVAYRSTEAVLNNRFIKVFWHSGMPNAGGVDGNHNATGNHATSNNGHIAKDDNAAQSGYPRKGNQYSLNNTVPANPTPASTEAGNKPTVAPNHVPGSNSVYSKTSLTVAPATVAAATSPAALAANRIRTNRINRAATEVIRKKKEEQVKELANGLHKRKHELVQGYLKQMHACVEMAGKLDASDPQRVMLLETIKTLQNHIDSLNKEIASDQAKIAAQVQAAAPVAAAPHPYRKSKELQKKELLDIELELIAQQQDGNDTTEIQKRLEELQRNMGTVPKTAFPVAVRGRVRPAPPGSTSFDRRPTTILVAGFSGEDCDALMGHFKHFGEITMHEVDKSTPFLKLTYAIRSNAEQAMLRGRRFKDQQIQISWYVKATEPPKIVSEDDLLDEHHIDEILQSGALEDEEDDEETEDRSWRR